MASCSILKTTGQRIAEMGLRILAGERPERIPQETAPSVMTVDWRELQRWGNQRRKASARERSQIQTTVILGALQVVPVRPDGGGDYRGAYSIAWLLFLRVRRRQAEADNLRLAGLAAAEHKRLDEIVSNVPGIVWGDSESTR